MGHELDVHDDTTWDAKISSVEWQQNECTIEIVVHAHNFFAMGQNYLGIGRNLFAFLKKNHFYTVQLLWA